MSKYTITETCVYEVDIPDDELISEDIHGNPRSHTAEEWWREVENRDRYFTEMLARTVEKVGGDDE